VGERGIQDLNCSTLLKAEEYLRERKREGERERRRDREGERRGGGNIRSKGDREKQKG
jgi:hypothetical protein